MIWSEALDPASSRSGAGGFRVKIPGANGPAVTAVAVDGADETKLRLTIADRIIDGTQNVTLEYTPPRSQARRSVTQRATTRSASRAATHSTYR